MRKLIFPLMALVPAVFPAGAQTIAPEHGLKAGYIATMFTGEVLPGQMDNFKQLVTKLVAAVAAQEPGALVYEISLQPDGKTYDTVEIYRNSAAVVAHGKHVRAEFGQELGQVVRSRIGASQEACEISSYGLPGCAGEGCFGCSQSCIRDADRWLHPIECPTGQRCRGFPTSSVLGPF